MQIVIPMSGFGERFRKAGYNKPKPLIEIDGRPIISYVIDMFPDEKDFIFICNQDHLQNKTYEMESTIKRYCPTGKIVPIQPHKLGPVHAARQAISVINSEAPVIVNYCDFTCYWDWNHFKEFVKKTGCDGAIPAYKGFHPHSLGDTNYAYIRENGGWIYDIQEKQSFTVDKMSEFASSGTYYFSSGKLMFDAFDSMVDLGHHLNGEYYVSLAYKQLLMQKRNVAVYELQHFMQWGTPEDVLQYLSWSKLFRGIMSESHDSMPYGSLILPMAGLGKRFSDAGYQITKPLIPVSGRKMVEQAVNDLPKTSHQVFVVRADMPEMKTFVELTKDKYPNSICCFVPSVTEGQACSALMGVYALKEKVNDYDIYPITFGACDNGVLYNENEYQKLMSDPNVDVIVWGARGHHNALKQPEMYGWIDSEPNGKINSISVKKPLGSIQTDPIVIGTFTFKKTDDFIKVVNRLFNRNGRVNGEFYLDSCINDAIFLGLGCYLLEVDHFISWGTPNDLKSYQYWQSCFHKWSHHPYLLIDDKNIPVEKIHELEDLYKALVPNAYGIFDA